MRERERESGINRYRKKCERQNEGKSERDLGIKRERERESGMRREKD